MGEMGADLPVVNRGHTATTHSSTSSTTLAFFDDLRLEC
ncbi:hypothetical protein I551_3320, partial [Mycobacterium ulcerans str. Harvey]